MTLIDDRVEEQVANIIEKAVAGSSASDAQNIKDRMIPILENKGKCVECGRGGDLPCFGMDFDGCDTHGGFMLDQDIVRRSYPVAWCSAWLPLRSRRMTSLQRRSSRRRPCQSD